MTASIDVSTERIFEVLMNVKDPEIDSVSIIDLGMVGEVITEGNNVKISSASDFFRVSGT